MRGLRRWVHSIGDFHGAGNIRNPLRHRNELRRKGNGPKRHGVYRSEAHALIERNRAGVFLFNVEEGFYVGGGVIAEKAVHQKCGVASASVRWMGDDRAD